MMVFWWWCVFLSNLGQMPRFNLYFFLTVYQHNTGLFCKTEAGCCLLPGSLYDNMCRKGHFLLEKHGKHTHIYTPLPKHMKTCSGTACKEISQCFDWAFKLFYFLFFFLKMLYTYSMQSINDICDNYLSKQVDQDTLEVTFHDLTWPALQSLPTDGLVCVCLTQCTVTCLLRATVGSKNLTPLKMCLLNIKYFITNCIIIITTWVKSWIEKWAWILYLVCPCFAFYDNCLFVFNFSLFSLMYRLFIVALYL